MPDDPAEPPPTFAGAMAQFRDVVDPIREATIGYRAQLIADGFSLESADSMAADFHRMVVTKVTSDLLARAKK